MPPADWTPHRRDDGELLGWIRPVGALWVAVDRLGRDLTDGIDWLEAEAALEARGLGWLAGRWTLDGAPVRIAELSDTRIVVVPDAYGAASAVGSRPARIELPWPAPDGLRSAPAAG